MGSFSWLHLVLAVLIIIFSVMGPMYVWLVIVFAAIIGILSIFGVCSCKSGYNSKKEVKPAEMKKAAKRKR